MSIWNIHFEINLIEILYWDFLFLWAFIYCQLFNKPNNYFEWELGDLIFKPLEFIHRLWRVTGKSPWLIKKRGGILFVVISLTMPNSSITWDLTWLYIRDINGTTSIQTWPYLIYSLSRSLWAFITRRPFWKKLLYFVPLVSFWRVSIEVKEAEQLNFFSWD
jgi:hypothetical protein